MRALVTCFLSNLSTNTPTLEKPVVEILDKRISDVFESIQKIKVYLDHLIKEKGAILDFNTDNKDILLFLH